MFCVDVAIVMLCVYVTQLCMCNNIYVLLYQCNDLYVLLLSNTMRCARVTIFQYLCFVSD